jgi:glyoxylase-like metal-dependent hydrolase (beta-lactamase superfamily II)
MKITDLLFTYEDKTRLWPRGNGCTVHLLRGPAKTIMIDTGELIGGYHKFLCRRLVKDGLNLKDVTEIWHTHAHPDHVNADLEVQQVSRAKIFTHPAAVNILKDVRTWLQQFIDILGEDRKFIVNVNPILYMFGMNFIAGMTPSISVTGTFTNGETRDIGFPVEVKFAPGHSPESVAFFVPSERILFTGDAFDLAYNTRPTLNNPLSDWTDLHASLEWMIQKRPAILANGHKWTIVGEDQCRAELEKAIGFLDEIKANVLAVLADGPSGLTDIIRRFPLKHLKYRGVERKINYWCTLRSLVKGGLVKRCPVYDRGKIKQLKWQLTP